MNSKPIHARIQKTMRELNALHLELEKPSAVEQSSQLCETPMPEAISYTSSVEPVTVNSAVETASTLVPARDRPLLRTNDRQTRWITPLSILLLYLVGILLAETLTTLIIPVAGVICHALVLAGLFIHGAMTRSNTFRRMLVTLSLAPLIRIISLSLPLQDYTFYLWYLLVGAPLFLSAFLVARYSGLRPAEIGLRLAGWPLQILIGLMGIGLGYLEYLILRPDPLANALTLEQVWLPGLILIIFTGLLEEVIFRGLMQKAFISGLGRLQGLLFVAVVFALLHMGYHSALDVVFVFGVAVLFGFISLRSNSILGVTLAHGLTNFCLFLVFPFLMS